MSILEDLKFEAKYSEGSQITQDIHLLLGNLEGISKPLETLESPLEHLRALGRS